MPERKREQLIGYLIGALEDSEREQIEARLEYDPRLREELALAEESLRPLRQTRRQYAPPPGLAARTCRWVELFAPPVVREAPTAACAAPRPGPRRARRMSAVSVPPSSRAGWSWADIAVASCILAVLTLLVFPAVQRSRMNARLLACQDHLHDLGLSLAMVNEKHPEFLPQFFRPDRQVAAGIPPSILTSGDEVDGLGALRRSVPPVRRLLPQMSFHPGITQMARGQNVLFADGRVVFLASGPTIGASRLWFFDGEPDPEPDVRPVPRVMPNALPPIVPVGRWGQ
jgi:hypothetical protein